MNTPTVVHPTKFRISGIIFEVVSVAALTNEQAQRIAMYFYKSRKFKKSDIGKTIQVITLFDGETGNLV